VNVVNVNYIDGKDHSGATRLRRWRTNNKRQFIILFFDNNSNKQKKSMTQTCEPDSAAAKSTSLTKNLSSLRSRHMMGLICHIRRPRSNLHHMQPTTQKRCVVCIRCLLNGNLQNKFVLFQNVINAVQHAPLKTWERMLLQSANVTIRTLIKCWQSTHIRCGSVERVNRVSALLGCRAWSGGPITK